MNERPTPETDAALLDSDCTYNCGHSFCFSRDKEEKQVAWGNEGIVVLADFARKLERQRDEAHKDLAEERHAWEKEREDWQADYAAVSIENKAMREAIKEARETLRSATQDHDRLLQENFAFEKQLSAMREAIKEAWIEIQYAEAGFAGLAVRVCPNDSAVDSVLNRMTEALAKLQPFLA